MLGEERFGHYRLIRPAGPGGMALVHIAERTGPNGQRQRCVVKRISADDATNPDILGMFIEESRLTSLLEHPNIVRTFEVGDVGGIPFIAMEFVDGINLLQLSKALAARHERVPLRAALEVGAAVADALSCAHTLTDAAGRSLNLIHRDVSPQNILISRTGEVKLTDFGIARHDAREHETMGAQVKGKVGYMAPEQWAGTTLDGRVDLFALGVVIIELLQADKVIRSYGDIVDIPARVSTCLAACSGLSPSLHDLLASMAANRPEDRPDSAADVALLLRASMDELPPGPDVRAVVRSVLPPEEIEDDEPTEEKTADLEPLVAKAAGRIERDTRGASYTSKPQSPAASVESARLLEAFLRDQGADHVNTGFGDDDEEATMRVNTLPEGTPDLVTVVEEDPDVTAGRLPPRRAPPRRPSSLSNLASRAFAWFRGDKP